MVCNIKNALLVFLATVLSVTSMQAASKPSMVSLLSSTTRPEEIKKALTNAGVSPDVIPLVCEYDVRIQNVKRDALVCLHYQSKKKSSSSLELPHYCPIVTFLPMKFPNWFAVQLFNGSEIRSKGLDPYKLINTVVYEYDTKAGLVEQRIGASNPLGGKRNPSGRSGESRIESLVATDTSIQWPHEDPYYELPLTDGNTLCLSTQKGAEEFGYWLKLPIKTSTSSGSPSSFKPKTEHNKRRGEILARLAAEGKEEDKNASVSSSSANPYIQGRIARLSL